VVFNCRTPRSGEIIKVKKFAFFPKRIDLDTVIWWEYYYEELQYLVGPGWQGWDSFRAYRIENEGK